jgi:hypothetical protein
MTQGRRAALGCLAGIAAVASGAGACEGNRQARVGEALLAQADSFVAAEAGATLAVTERDVTALPSAPVVRLAIDVGVPWGRVVELLERIEAEGKRAVLLVGNRRGVAGFRLYDALEGEPIELLTYPDGKACVKPRESIEAACVQSAAAKHIDRAYVREFVREARKAYDLRDVEVEIPPELTWGDVVRAIDGARTCCKDGSMRVAIKDFPR